MRTSIRLWLLFAVFVFWMHENVQAQSSGGEPANRFFNITVGMGVGAHSAPSVADYVNAVAQPRTGQRLDEFTSVIEFFVAPELQMAEEWSAALEYGLLLKGYTLDDQSGYLRSDFSYQVHMPTLLLQYVLFGDGYRLKLGGGLGYHFVRFNQSYYAYGSEETFHAGGVGLKLGAVGNTQFDETFFGSIGVDLRWDFLGALKRGDGSEVIDRVTNTVLKMNCFTLVVKFGVMFQL
ncbi:MAG: hypothetical protein FJ217_12300 [Ignavibacteria bacterium]|nr:hypothetical protein [Ignavibacteria bacterium]